MNDEKLPFQLKKNDFLAEKLAFRSKKEHFQRTFFILRFGLWPMGEERVFRRLYSELEFLNSLWGLGTGEE
jgi:hypothetical protein